MKIKILIVIILIFNYCAINNLSGNSSDTDTGSISGIITDKYDKAVKQAKVTLRLEENIIMESYKKEELLKTRITFTNSKGYYHIDSLNVGEYFIEVNDHDTAGCLMGTKVVKDELSEANDTTQTFGTIVGLLDSSIIQTNQKMYFYILELQRKHEIDSKGNFTAPNLPIFKYRTKILAGESVVNTLLDSIKIETFENDTAKIIKIGAETGTIIINGEIIESLK